MAQDNRKKTAHQIAELIVSSELGKKELKKKLNKEDFSETDGEELLYDEDDINLNEDALSEEAPNEEALSEEEIIKNVAKGQQKQRKIKKKAKKRKETEKKEGKKLIKNLKPLQIVAGIGAFFVIAFLVTVLVLSSFQGREKKEQLVSAPKGPSHVSPFKGSLPTTNKPANKPAAQKANSETLGTIQPAEQGVGTPVSISPLVNEKIIELRKNIKKLEKDFVQQTKNLEKKIDNNTFAIKLLEQKQSFLNDKVKTVDKLSLEMAKNRRSISEIERSLEKLERKIGFHDRELQKLFEKVAVKRKQIQILDNVSFRIGNVVFFLGDLIDIKGKTYKVIKIDPIQRNIVLQDSFGQEWLLKETGSL